MIETRAALEALDDILAVPGVDGVLVGPADLSAALTGGPPDPAHPEVDRSLDRVASRARAAGKFAAMFCSGGKQAKAMAARGFALCSVAVDSGLLGQAARAKLADARCAGLPAMTVRDPLFLTIAELAPEIREARISPVEVTRVCGLDRIERVDPDLALAQAGAAESEIRAGRYRGPLHGVPVAVTACRRRGARSRAG